MAQERTEVDVYRSTYTSRDMLYADRVQCRWLTTERAVCIYTCLTYYIVWELWIFPLLFCSFGTIFWVVRTSLKKNSIANLVPCRFFCFFLSFIWAYAGDVLHHTYVHFFYIWQEQWRLSYQLPFFVSVSVFDVFSNELHISNHFYQNLIQ